MKIFKKIIDYIISLALIILISYILGYFKVVEPLNSIIKFIITLGGNL